MQDWSCASDFKVSTDGVTVSLSLGSERTLSLTSSTHVSLMGCDNSTFELSSGTIDHPAGGKEIYLLSPSSPASNKKYTNNTFRITGQGTLLQTFNKAVVSAKGSGGTFEIANGAEFKGGIRFYNNASTDQTVLVSDGGTLTSYMTYNNTGECAYPSQGGGGTGCATIVDGGTLTAKTLSFANTGWNFEVKNGGKAQFSAAGSSLGNKSSFNEITVGDNGVFESKTVNNGQFFIGNGNGATGNVVRVLSGGTMRFTDAFDDDSSCSYGKFELGYGEGSASNRVEVLGGTLITDRVYVGGDNAPAATGNSLVVSNGTMKTWHVAFSPKGGDNMLDIAGTTSAITTQSQMTFTNTVITLDFADGAYTSIPLQAEAGTLIFYNGTTFTLTNIKPVARAGGATVTIARRTAGAITVASGLLDAWNTALAADESTKGCAFSLSNSNKDLVLKLPAAPGLAIIVR